jgi:hypothetical protein
VEHLETRAGERRSGRSFRRSVVEDSHAGAASGSRLAGRSTADDSLPGRCRSDELEAATPELDSSNFLAPACSVSAEEEGCPPL